MSPSVGELWKHECKTNLGRKMSSIIQALTIIAPFCVVSKATGNGICMSEKIQPNYRIHNLLSFFILQKINVREHFSLQLRLSGFKFNQSFVQSILKLIYWWNLMKKKQKLICFDKNQYSAKMVVRWITGNDICFIFVTVNNQIHVWLHNTSFRSNLTWYFSI